MHDAKGFNPEAYQNLEVFACSRRPDLYWGLLFTEGFYFLKQVLSLNDPQKQQAMLTDK